MLGRTLNDRNNGIGRSNSSASISRRNAFLVPESVDPQIARHHAVTAANVAMGRAQERVSADLRRSTELSRANSFKGRDQSTTSPPQHVIRLSSAAELKRQRSILRQRAPSLASSLHLPDDSPPTNFTAIPPIDEFGVPLGYGSVPSSYRRLRKAKSLLAPGRRTMSFLGKPESPRIVRPIFTTAGANTHIKLGLRRSLSFLKLGSNSQKPSARVASSSESHDAAIQLARDQFLLDIEQQRTKDRSSFFSSSRKRRPQKSFRKTVRSSKKTDFDDTIASQNQPVAVSTSPTNSRSFSSSVKSRIRRLLGRASAAQQQLPAQQLVASRPHFRDYIETSIADMSTSYSPEYLPDSSRRNAMYIPSGLQPSKESLGLMSNSVPLNDIAENFLQDRSRVTSWTDASTGNSSSARAQVDRKRLSIIQEHGSPHHPSCSIGRHIDEVSVFREPLSNIPRGGPSSPPVDSQRIYSALLRRIDQSETEEGARLESLSSNAELKSVPYHARDAIYQRTRTVRAVQTDMSPPPSSSQNLDSDTHTPQESSYCADDSDAASSANHQLNIIKRESRLGEARSSSFFPFSNEDKPDSPSPFRMALVAAKREHTDISSYGSSIHHIAPHKSWKFGSKDFPDSTSRISNACDQNPIEIFFPDEREPSMATIYSDNGQLTSRPSSALVDLSNTNMNSTSSLKAWMDSQLALRDRRRSKGPQGNGSVKSDQTHYRENAQIDGEDTSIGRFNQFHQTEGGRLTSTSSRLPLVERKQVSRNYHRRPDYLLGYDKNDDEIPLRASTYNDENTPLPGDRSVCTARGFMGSKTSWAITSPRSTSLSSISQGRSQTKRSAPSLFGDWTPSPEIHHLRSITSDQR